MRTFIPVSFSARVSVGFSWIFLAIATGVGAERPLQMPRFANTTAGAIASPVAVPAGKAAGAARLRQSDFYGNLPLTFEQNLGQAGAGVRFLSRADGHRIFLERDGAVLQFPRSGESRSENVRIRFLGANKRPVLEGVDQLESRANYYIGRTAEDWHPDVPNYARVRYRAVWPGVDVVFYGNG